uniref:Uncharacterized protein n=6 Tax=Aegilops tauschii subsp. strangulata TaxID=200361 RepID=A0A453B947_AEGTS
TTLPFLSFVSTRNPFRKAPTTMASRMATVVLAGALPVPPRAPTAAAGGTKFVVWTKRPSFHHGIRCGVARAPRSRPQHASSPSTAEVAATLTPNHVFRGLRRPYLHLNGLVQEGVLELLKSAVAAIAIIAQISVALPANAVLYSPDTNVPRTGELALRRAIPANPSMKTIQNSLEDISYLLRIPQRKPYGSMEGDVKKAMQIATENKEAMLASMPAELKEKGSELYITLLEGKGGLQTLLKYIKDKDNDRLSVALASSLDTIAELELLQAPGLSFLLPKQYLEYPRLTGRAVVEFTVEKGDGSTFFPTAGGEPKSAATIQVVVDGYSAPLTAGNIAKLVLDGAYDGATLKSVSQAIIVDSETGKKGYTLPLEVMPAGQFEPLYRSPLSIQDGELPVLPMSVYGSVAMSHSEDSDEYSSPTQFFFYLYDKRNSGLGGISFEEGDNFQFLGMPQTEEMSFHRLRLEIKFARPS